MVLRPTLFPSDPPPLQAFATYLLIAWLTSNIIFAQIVNILSALEWEVRPRRSKGVSSRSQAPAQLPALRMLFASLTSWSLTSPPLPPALPACRCATRRPRPSTAASWRTRSTATPTWRRRWARSCTPRRPSWRTRQTRWVQVAGGWVGAPTGRGPHHHLAVCRRRQLSSLGMHAGHLSPS